MFKNESYLQNWETQGLCSYVEVRARIGLGWVDQSGCVLFENPLVCYTPVNHGLACHDWAQPVFRTLAINEPIS